MTVALPVLPLADVRTGADRFHCGPFDCDLRADSCVARQHRARRPNSTHEHNGHLAACVACPDGLRVERVLRDPSAPTNDVAPIPAQRAARTAASKAEGAAAIAAVEARAQHQEAPVKETKSATCNHPDGCKEEPGGVRVDTNPAWAGWCRKHRKAARDASPKKPAAPKVARVTGGGTAPKVTRAPKVASTTKLARPPISDPFDTLRREHEVVLRLGDVATIERALERSPALATLVRELGA